MANRIDALSHDDTMDREVARNFLERNGWYDIEFGGEKDLDLEVKIFKRGCDVEMINYGIDRFEKFNHFRIPNRKEHYWSGSNLRNGKYGKWNNKYKDWYIDYIQFLNSDLTELIWYNWKTIKQYRNNLFFDKVLVSNKGFTESESTFIVIPYNKNLIKHYKLTNGIWTRQIN